MVSRLIEISLDWLTSNGSWSKWLTAERRFQELCICTYLQHTERVWASEKTSTCKLQDKPQCQTTSATLNTLRCHTHPCRPMRISFHFGKYFVHGLVVCFDICHLRIVYFLIIPYFLSLFTSLKHEHYKNFFINECDSKKVT